MIPLSVTVRIQGKIALPSGALALDSLLAAAVALRDNMPPPASALDIAPIEIPIQREPGGEFHLASFAMPIEEQHESRWTNRRFPVAEAQWMSELKFKRIQINGGPCKSYRLPISLAHVENDTLQWWCMGEAEPIRELLSLIHFLGKRRAVGYGAVARGGWSVEPCEPWGEGFPVVRDGKPLRPLPVDWPGLVGPETEFCTITYPYQKRLNHDVRLCAVPERR